MAEVKLENVTKRYGNKTVLENLSLSIRDGECFTLLGPSACGKTTVVRAICGLEELESGEISIGDNIVFSKEKGIFVPPEKRNIGVVFQDYAVWPHMTVYENVLYPLIKRGVPKTEAPKLVEGAIKNVRLDGMAERLPYQLSGGQQQRVALARALVSSRELVCLDEPLSNLDANLRKGMAFEIKELQRKFGVTIFYVTHDQEVALAISDRIAVMDRSGRIRQVGTPEEVYRNPVDSFVFRFMGLSNFLSLEARGNELFIPKDSDVIGAGAAFPYPLPDDINIKTNRLFAACRPRDIKLTHAGKLKGKVLRVIFLGDIYEYRVQLGKNELRAQEDSYKALQRGLFKEGDICGIEFENLRYYERVEEV